MRDRWWLMVGGWWLTGGLIALLTISCATAPLPNAQANPEVLSRAVLSALEARDTGALRALALSKEEFEAHVWPHLPAARPERNLSPPFIWGDLHRKSHLTLRSTLAAHGGRKYEFVSVRFLGATTAYGSYRVHRESELTVRLADGTDRQMRVFGSVIEKDGRYKVFSYVVDD